VLEFVNVSKVYASHVILNNVSFRISSDDSLGLVGANGAGKTTIFRMIACEESPDSGTIQRKRGLRVGYLPQEIDVGRSGKVLDEVLQALPEYYSVSLSLLELEHNPHPPAELVDRRLDLLVRYDELGGDSVRAKACEILGGLGFATSDFGRPLSTMSGGWHMRVKLARLLLSEPELLLLDEPTNYLDLNAAIWLKDYLAGFQGTFIMISHDKDFLTDVTNYTLVLEHGMISKVKGSYEHYEQIKAERRLFLERQFKEQEKKRIQLEEFVARFHAQPNKAAAVRSKRTILEKMEQEKIVLPPDPRESIADFQFPASRPSGQLVMQLEKISKAYGDIRVYQDFDFEIQKGEKAVLVGENGAGKSTLLKIMAGVVPID